jgi:acetylornithine aminotransferase
MSSLLDRETHAVMQTYTRIPIVFTHGSGTWLTDEGGRQYLDFLTGLAVVSVGHANPRVAAAVAAQMATLVHVSNIYVTEPMVRLAERLDVLSGLDRVFFANCGATANEAAIKLARRWGQTTKGPECYEVISLLDSFHGRSLATLAATGQPAKQAVFEPLPPGFHQVPPGEFEKLADAITDSTAAVMVETTQGEGGVVPLPADYLRAVRALCDEREILLIVDDVQAGVGRTGSWFSWQQLGFVPDIATTAKALANGLPIGACVARGAAAEAFTPGRHGSTFGGNPLVTRTACTVLDIMRAEDLAARAARMGDGMLESFRRRLASHPAVRDVRGRGLMIGIELDRDVNQLKQAALQRGLLINVTQDKVIRLLPPLIIDPAQAEQIVEGVCTLVDELGE